ncbi:MAG: hypothetical protein M3Z32_05680 [Acidobacteriota bacterium]|nr:hypothetical protein [Acidobacteriota bacterium]
MAFRMLSRKWVEQMKNHILYGFVACAALTSAASAQSFQRQAAITGGGSPDRGKCTIEVVVDGVAQVEVRGTSATIRNLSGQPPQWRRFECTGPMPANPTGFRFQGVDGRGRQDLVRDPRQGGAAVVEIEDKEGGAEAYTFDLMWDSRANGGGNQPYYNPGTTNGNAPVYRDNGSQPGYRNDPNQPGYRNDPNQPGYQNDANQPGYRNDPNQPGYRSDDRYRGNGDGDYRPNYRDSDYYRRYGHGFAAQEAIRLCQQAVALQATRRFGSAEVHFHQTRMEDNPGRNDWVSGSLDVHRGGLRSEMYHFACSVNFENGQVRSAQLDPRPTRDQFR